MQVWRAIEAISQGSVNRESGETQESTDDERSFLQQMVN